jgi:hypothetical protein
MHDDDMESYALSSKIPDSDGYDSKPSGYRCSGGVRSWETCISCPHAKSSVSFPSRLLFGRIAKQRNYRVVFICGLKIF